MLSDPGLARATHLKQRMASLGLLIRKERSAGAMPKAWQNPEGVASAASGMLLSVGWLLGRDYLAEPLPTDVYIAAAVVGGYYFGRQAIEELVFKRAIGVELLMSVAAVIAILAGETFEGSLLVFLHALVRVVRGYTEQHARSAARALMDLIPTRATVRRDGREQHIPVTELLVDDVCVVRPGEVVPTDGQVLAGRSTVDQAPLTEGAAPVEKRPGDRVFAGSVNGDGSLDVRATWTVADSTSAHAARMLDEAFQRTSASQRLVERVVGRYCPIILLVGAFAAFVPPVVLGTSWTAWGHRAAIIIVAAAPIALVASIPLAIAASLVIGARRGILFRDGASLERLAKTGMVALDKISIFTNAEPEVTDVVLCQYWFTRRPRTVPEILAVAAGVARRSDLPMAPAIVRRTEAEGVRPVTVADFHALPDNAASALLGSQRVYVGGPHFFGRLGVSLLRAAQDINRLQDHGKTVVVVGDEDAPWALIGIRESVRPDAAQAVADLHATGVRKVALLTGDDRRAAQAVAREVGIDDVYAELRPEDVGSQVRTLTRQYGSVAFVGDAVNDAPALAAATVGVAMGVAGADVALEVADVAIVADDLNTLVCAVRLARRARAVVNQNLALSAIVIVALVVGALADAVSLPAAVLGQEIGGLVVIANSLRLLRS